MEKISSDKIPLWQDRSAMLLGEDNIEKFKHLHVLIVGLGGVGAVAAEFVARAGVGKLTIADGDRVDPTNRNRQLPGLISNQGKYKTEVLASRLLDINPELEIGVITKFIRDEETDILLENHFDYVIDAIDSLSPKVNLIAKTIARGYPLVSSMGAGGKVDPAQIAVADISKSYNCKLAKAIRKRLHRRGIRKGFKVVFSPEDVKPEAVFAWEDAETGKSVSRVGTVSYMPALFGCFCASAVIRDLAGMN